MHVSWLVTAPDVDEHGNAHIWLGRGGGDGVQHAVQQASVKGKVAGGDLHACMMGGCNTAMVTTWLKGGGGTLARLPVSCAPGG